MALIDDFKARFTEFDTSVVDQYFPLLEPTVSCYYGGSVTVACEKEAILQILAHLITLESSSSSAPPKSIVSQSVGSVSQTFAASSGSGADVDFYSSTKYGARYLFLTASSIGGHFV